MTPGGPEGYRTEILLLKNQHTRAFTPNTQQRGSSLKSIWVLHERNLLLTNFRACAGRAGISRNFTGNGIAGKLHYSCPLSAQPVQYWQETVLTISNLLACLPILNIPVERCTPPNLPTQRAPLKNVSCLHKGGGQYHPPSKSTTAIAELVSQLCQRLIPPTSTPSAAVAVNRPAHQRAGY